jgi:hypothetical protein
MSLLSTLAKIGGVVAAPFSGGASLALTGLGTIGDVLGKQQQGAAQGQAAQANLQQGQDRNAVSLYQAQQNAQNQAAQTDLQRQSFESQNRSKTALQGLIGALLGGGVTPTSISGGQASGGLLRSLNANPEALASMKTLGAQGASAQNTPTQFTGGELVKPPSLTPLPETGGGSNLLSVLARIAQLGGAAGSIMPAKEPQ